MLSKHFKLMTFWLQSFFSMPDSSFELFLYAEFVFNQKQDKQTATTMLKRQESLLQVFIQHVLKTQEGDGAKI